MSHHQTVSTEDNQIVLPKLDLWGNIAVRMGKLASRLSKMTGRGNGGMIGGHVAMKLDKRIMSKLAHGKTVVLVTGTNGKSTTTKMVCAALKTLGQVATNDLGDNMYGGVVTAMINNPKAPYVVLEVDELHLETVAKNTNPTGIVLLNLTPDQLDRYGEIAVIERKVRAGVNAGVGAFVVANCDDPLVTSAAWDKVEKIWCACSLGQKIDCLVSPRTNGVIRYDGNSWVGLDSENNVTSFVRPNPDWFYGEDGVLNGTPVFSGENVPVAVKLDLQLPGKANEMNAMQAIACAVRLGANVDEVVKAVNGVENVAGRYSTVDVDGRKTHMLLAKNPAGWAQAISMVSSDADSIVIGVNGMVGDGVDLSWLWDISFEPLRVILENNPDCKIYACGQRGADLSVRLEYCGIPHKRFVDPMDAIFDSPKGNVELIANYTSFHEVKHEVISKGYEFL